MLKFDFFHHCLTTALNCCHNCICWHHLPRGNHAAKYPTGMHFDTVNTLRPRQNGRHFPDDIFKCIFLNENVWISIKFSLKFVPKGPINNIPALVQMMAWRRPGDKPLSEPMLVSLLTHKCITRPQWVKHILGEIHLMFTLYSQSIASLLQCKQTGKLA